MEVEKWFPHQIPEVKSRMNKNGKLNKKFTLERRNKMYAMSYLGGGH